MWKKFRIFQFFTNTPTHQHILTLSHSQKWCLKCMFFPPLRGCRISTLFLEGGWSEKCGNFYTFFNSSKFVHQKKPKRTERSATHCIGLGEQFIALITLVLHGLEAVLARGEGGGVQGRHRAALANTGRAVAQGGEGGGCSRVTAWINVVNCK